jgi:rod shape-determining protein MreB and related proteins
MIRRLFNSLGSTMYVQIWSSHIKVTDVRTGKVFDDEPLVALENKGGKRRFRAFGSAARQLASADVEVINPFQHPRVLFADFVVGEELLKHILSSFYRHQLIAPAPAIVIHAMEKTEGGLTMIERRAFTELGLGAGARIAEVYEGPELPISGFEETFKARQSAIT